MRVAAQCLTAPGPQLQLERSSEHDACALCRVYAQTDAAAVCVALNHAGMCAPWERSVVE